MSPEDALYDFEIREVSCPKCGAERHQRCIERRLYDTAIADEPHAERVEAARKRRAR